jgi:membrane-associated phospholipid phosphatase
VRLPSVQVSGAKALALAWGPLVSLAVVVTGNHYVFDIAAGLLVTTIGYTITRPIRRRPGSAPLTGEGTCSPAECCAR